MPYFLDGNNLIGLARGTPRPDDGDRDALVAELCDRLRRTRAKAVLFFDGPAGSGGTVLGNLAIRHGGSRTADEAILREIASAAAPQEITLVTADRNLARRAEDAGARTLSPSAFWRRFAGDAQAVPRPAIPVDVEDWMRYFSDESNRGEKDEP